MNKKRKSCRECKHCKPYQGFDTGFWCDYLSGLILWESVRDKTMCGDEGFDAKNS
jgi:hypothetical protein